MPISITCPSCDHKLRAPDNMGGHKAKCPKCGAAIVIPPASPQAVPQPAKSAGPPPLPAKPETTAKAAHENEPDVDSCPDSQPAAAISVSAFARHLWRHAQGLEISTCGAGIGLFLLALSPFFKWISFGAGGVMGLAGDGKIVLGVTLLATAAFVVALSKKRWLVPIFLGVQAWGTLAAFWMGALIWKVGSLLTSSPELKDNPFAVMLAVQISPGAGLYLGLIGGIVVAGALGFAAVRRLLLAGNLKPFYACQCLSCFLGILLAFFVGPDLAPKTNDTATGSLFSSQTSELGVGQKVAPAGPVIPLGKPHDAPGFRATLLDARIDLPELKDWSGEIRRGEDPNLILQFRVKNTDERKILRYQELLLTSNFELHDDASNSIRGVTHGGVYSAVGALTGSEDILPGEEATHVELFSVPPIKTKHLIVTMNLNAFRGEGTIRFKILAKQIKGFPPEGDLSAVGKRTRTRRASPIPRDPQEEWREKHNVSAARWDEMTANFIARKFPQRATAEGWWKEARDKTPAQLDEAYPPLEPREWYCAAWVSGVESRKLDDSYSISDTRRYWLNMFLNIRTEPNLVIKELYGRLRIQKDQKTIYETPIAHKPDLSFKNNCYVMHKINPYDDTNEVHRTLRYAEDTELAPIFTVSKVVLADGTEKTFEK